MTMNNESTLDILLVAQSSVRVSQLHCEMNQVGLCCTLRRVDPGKKATAYLTARTPYRNAKQPDLVLIDFSKRCDTTLDTVKHVALGESRSTAPIVLLTSQSTEELLENGALEADDATMFSSHALTTFLAKLVGRRKRGFLRALHTLYQYGPIMTRMPRKLTYEQAGFKIA